MCLVHGRRISNVSLYYSIYDPHRKSTALRVSALVLYYCSEDGEEYELVIETQFMYPVTFLYIAIIQPKPTWQHYHI